MRSLICGIALLAAASNSCAGQNAFGELLNTQGSPRSVQAAPPVEKEGFPLTADDAAGMIIAGEYKRKADKLGALTLDEMMRALAKVCVEHPRFYDNPWVEAKGMIMGIAQWLDGNGAGATFQGRHDWALHFAYGAYLAIGGQDSYKTAKDTAYGKEIADASTDWNFFDYGDYCATMIGAEWGAKASAPNGEQPDAEQTRAWIAGWASGEKRLGDIPHIKFGHLKPREMPDESVILKVDAFAKQSMGK